MSKKYRDGLFRKYFSDKRRLLELCNGLLGEDGTDPNEIEITTLDGTFFDELKNDLSCIYRGKFLVIVEHQSTINENMPLRMFLYASEIFKQYTKSRKKKIYFKEKIMLPTPEFFVFYNGAEKELERREMKLSDAFFVAEDFLEVRVQVYNINAGFNAELIEKILPLENYCTFVNRVQKNLSQGIDLDHAIAEAYDFCVKNDVMREFLKSMEGDLVSMLGLEYDAEEAKQAYIEYGEEKGRREGRKEGEEKGRKEGRLEEKVEMVKNMLSIKLPIEQIIQISGWSKEKILKLGANF